LNKHKSNVSLFVCQVFDEASVSERQQGSFENKTLVDLVDHSMGVRQNLINSRIYVYKCALLLHHTESKNVYTLHIVRYIFVEIFFGKNVNWDQNLSENRQMAMSTSFSTGYELSY
jgi:hypothetical protein